jgi:hypothetical protein
MTTMTNRLLPTIFISYLNYGSSKCGFTSSPAWFPLPLLALGRLLDVIQVPTLSRSPSTKKRDERYQSNVNQRSKCLVGSPEGKDTIVLETSTRLNFSTAPVAIFLLLPIKLQPSLPARMMTTRHVQVRLVRVGAAIPPGKPQELDYQLLRVLL